MSEAEVQISCIQFEPRIGEMEQNVATSVSLIGDAAAGGSKLIVLPELCNSGYVLNSREEAYELSETVETGNSIAAWRAAAADMDIHIVAGFIERQDDRLYNSAVVLGPKGLIGTYRKNHLWNAESALLRARRPWLSRLPHAVRPDRRPDLLRRLVPRGMAPAGAPGRRSRLRPDQLGADGRAAGERPGNGEHPVHGRRPQQLHVRRRLRPDRDRARPAFHRPEPDRQPQRLARRRPRQRVRARHGNRRLQPLGGAAPAHLEQLQSGHAGPKDRPLPARCSARRRVPAGTDENKAQNKPKENPPSKQGKEHEDASAYRNSGIRNLGPDGRRHERRRRPVHRQDRHPRRPQRRQQRGGALGRAVGRARGRRDQRGGRHSWARRWSWWSPTTAAARQARSAPSTRWSSRTRSTS